MAKQITLTIHIRPATAVRAGRSQAGETTVTLSDDDLAALTPAQRETLALHLEGASFPAPWAVRTGCHYGEPLHRYASPVADASLETIAALLLRRYVEDMHRAIDVACQPYLDLLRPDQTLDYIQKVNHMGPLLRAALVRPRSGAS